MKRQMIFAALLAILSGLTLLVGLVPGILWQGAKETRVVGLILDTDIGLHAATIKQGAKLAARELKAELIANAPVPGEDGTSSQRVLWERQFAQGISALMLVPTSDAVAEEATLAAKAANVKLVLLDGGTREDRLYVSTDHAESGAQAIAAIEARAEAPVRLLVLTRPSQDALCAQRLAGAMGAIDESDAIELTVTEVMEDDGSAEDAQLRRALAKNPGIGAVLCMDGALTEVAARTLTALGKAKDICLVGFDCDQTRVTYLQSGAVAATVLRSPLNIGYLGLYRALGDGGNVRTPSFIVDRENMLDPTRVKLLFPLVR